MTALIIKAPGQMSEPGDAATLPDIESALLYDFNPEAIPGKTNGMDVTSLTSLAGTRTDVTLEAATGASEAGPLVPPKLTLTATPSGRAGIRFNPATPSYLRSSSHAALNVPVTYVMVIRSHSSSSAAARILSGPSAGYHTLRSDRGSYTVGAQTAKATGLSATLGWEVIVMVLGGANGSYLYRNADASGLIADAGTTASTGLNVGSSTTPGPDSLWDGTLARLQAFGRAFTASDAQTIIAKHRQNYGIV